MSTTSEGTVAAVVQGVYNITKYDEDEIHQAVGTTGPVSIAYDVASDFKVELSLSSFLPSARAHTQKYAAKDYQGGIYASTLCGNTTSTVNHAVLAVGYNKAEDGTKYWIVKNSWSWGWGMEGYFWIERGDNMCGLASCASFPVLPHPV